MDFFTFFFFFFDMVLFEESQSFCRVQSGWSHAWIQVRHCSRDCVSGVEPLPGQEAPAVQGSVLSLVTFSLVV